MYTESNHSDSPLLIFSLPGQHWTVLMIHQSASAFCLALESTDQQSRHLAMQPLALNKWQKLTLTQCHTVKNVKTPLQLGLCCCKLFKILWVHHCISILTAPYTHRQQPNFLQHLIQSVKLNSTSHYLLTPDNGSCTNYIHYIRKLTRRDTAKLLSWHRTGISGENVLSSGLTYNGSAGQKEKGREIRLSNLVQQKTWQSATQCLASSLIYDWRLAQQHCH